jgi:hypothetical protein
MQVLVVPLYVLPNGQQTVSVTGVQVVVEHFPPMQLCP